MATGGINLSKEFFELLKAIGESKSKQEEDRIIAKEVVRLKSKMESPASTTPGQPAQQNQLLASKKRAKEFLVRLLYVEMLGHDGSFGYIKAVEMAASASLFHKRTGYLICGACLSPDNEFRFMLVNQMQRDLNSTNVLECSGGLLACTRIITPDMVPAVSTEVTKLLAHDSATIRKKAIVCLHRCHQLAPEVVDETILQENLRKVLCDKDPSVMGSSLNVIEALAVGDPTPYKDLVPSLVSILKQIGDHRLTADYEYHRVPAPWMQMKLIRILGVLGRADASASAGMYEMLADMMKKADTGINAGYAIVYECIKTIVTIYPNTQLLENAAQAITRFIDSRAHNLKYLGVTGLAMIVEQHPEYAAQHQLAVMDCLEDPDETLQRKTLDLLYRMTNPVNVEFIADKLIDFLSETTDLFLKKVLTTRVCTIAERYAPNNQWYVQTITRLFEVAGDMVSQDVAQNLMSLIAEGTSESEEADMALRQHAIELYVNILTNKPVGSLPRILLETMAWCLGEYGYLSAVSTTEDVLRQLCVIAKTQLVFDAAGDGGSGSQNNEKTMTTRKFLLQAIFKLTAQLGVCPPHAAAVIDDYTRSMDVDVQQRCLEFQNLLTACPQLLPEILPVDASAEDLELDTNLSFLDGFIQQKLAEGARPYEKPEDDFDDEDDEDYAGYGASARPAFNMTPYEKPTQPSSGAVMGMKGMGSSSAHTAAPPGVSLPPGAVPSHHAAAAPAQAVAAAAAGPGEPSLNTRNVANVWGRGGVQQQQPAQQEAAIANAAAPAAPPKSWETSSADTTGGGFAAAANASASSSPYGGSGYGGSSGPAPPPAPPVKTAQQLEKERQAAALFGGIVPGSAAPPPAATAPPAAAAPAAAPAAPAPPPAPAPDVDLLDMMAWDAPAPAPAGEAVAATPEQPPPPAVAPDGFDMLSGGGETAAPVVETISDDDDDPSLSAAAAPPAPAPAPPQPAAAAPASDDPFASAGLLEGLSDTPLATFATPTTTAFEYNGSVMAPMPINTAQFGQQWQTCKATSPLSLQSTKVATLDQFMQICGLAGCHKVEAIAATNEGICAGMLNAGSQVVLIHGKVATAAGAGGTKLDVTVKGSEQNLTGTLAMYLQTQLR